MANVKNKMSSPKNNSANTNGKGKKSRKHVEDTVMNPVQNNVPSEPQDSLSNDSFNKNLLKIHKGSLLTKSGIIKKKSRINLELMNNILKSELLIQETNNHKKSKNPINSTVESLSQSVNNNNYSAIKPDKIKEQKSSDVPIKSTGKPTLLKDFSKDVNIKLQSKNSKLRKKNLKDKSTKAAKKDDASKRSSKMKQVTLSNGLVLTLSLYQCDYCQKTFSNKSSIRRHIYVHLDYKPYSCMRCPKRFRQRSNLRVHMLKVHEEISATPERYICSQCDKSFLLKENLNLHLSTHIKTENSFQCAFCDKKFSHQLLLIQHEKQHLHAGRYQCSICKMSYDSRSQLSLHVKSHLNIKDFVCQYCGKEFLRPNSIRRHVEICHGGHRIQCPICLKKLKGHLSEHLRTHKNLKPHECPECGQRFTQSTQLNVHRRSHTGARPYPCRICGRPFSHSNALMLHIRRHTGEKPFPCAMCPTSFSQLPHMKAHMSKIHGKNDPYKCQNCSRFFKLKIHLEDHTKTCAVDKVVDDKVEPPGLDSAMSLSRMRFLLALLLTMIASKEKLKYLGFNKRLIDDLLIESLEAMGQKPCKDQTFNPLRRLKMNIQLLLNGTVPKDQMKKFREDNMSTEQLLEILTDEKKIE